MIFPILTNAERMALEEMATHGPRRELAVPVRGRLALYKLIDETPKGWNITAYGRQALQAAPLAAAAAPSQRTDSNSGGNGRHYGKKNRDTSWFR